MIWGQALAIVNLHVLKRGIQELSSSNTAKTDHNFI